MIVSQIANITQQQLDYSYFVKANREDRYVNEFERNMLQACYFITQTTFNLAHWFFAFSYLVLSYQIEITKEKLPEDTFSRRLNALNIVVCIFTLGVQAIIWVFAVKKAYKAADIADYVQQLSLITSCVILVVGIKRLVRLVQSLGDQLPNKITIAMHIVAYLAIIIINIL